MFVIYVNQGLFGLIIIVKNAQLIIATIVIFPHVIGVNLDIILEVIIIYLFAENRSSCIDISQGKDLKTTNCPRYCEICSSTRCLKCLLGFYFDAKYGECKRCLRKYDILCNDYGNSYGNYSCYIDSNGNPIKYGYDMYLKTYGCTIESNIQKNSQVNVVQTFSTNELPSLYSEPTIIFISEKNIPVSIQIPIAAPISALIPVLDSNVPAPIPVLDSNVPQTSTSISAFEKEKPSSNLKNDTEAQLNQTVTSNTTIGQNITSTESPKTSTQIQENQNITIKNVLLAGKFLFLIVLIGILSSIIYYLREAIKKQNKIINE